MDNTPEYIEMCRKEGEMKNIGSLAVVFCWIFFVLLVYEMNFDINRIHFVEIPYPDAWAMYETTVTKPMTIKTDKPVIIMMSTFENISGDALTLITKSGYNSISYCTVSDVGGYGISITDETIAKPK